MGSGDDWWGHQWCSRKGKISHEWTLGRSSIRTRQDCRRCKNFSDGVTAASHQCESCWRLCCRCESPYHLFSVVFKTQQHKWKWRPPLMIEAGNNTTMPPTFQLEDDSFSPRRWKMNNLIEEISSVHPLPRPCLCWNLSRIAGHIAKYVVRHFVCWWSKERRRPFQNSRQRRLSGKPAFKISIFRQIQLLNQSCQAIKHTIDHVNLLSSIIRKRDIYFNCRMSTMQTFLRT